MNNHIDVQKQTGEDSLRESAYYSIGMDIVLAIKFITGIDKPVLRKIKSEPKEIIH